MPCPVEIAIESGMAGGRAWVKKLDALDLSKKNGYALVGKFVRQTGSAENGATWKFMAEPGDYFVLCAVRPDARHYMLMKAGDEGPDTDFGIMAENKEPPRYGYRGLSRLACSCCGVDFDLEAQNVQRLHPELSGLWGRPLFSIIKRALSVGVPVISQQATSQAAAQYTEQCERMMEL